MEELIRIINVRGLYPNDKSVVYCGRAFAGWNASPLGNPYKGKNAIADYRKWLWKEIAERSPAYDELVRLAAKATQGETIVLGCWCKPAPCHCDVIKRAILWLCGYKKEMME